jgi:leader peptidase (prepilin peptidase)/N-methyltransferase
MAELILMVPFGYLLVASVPLIVNDLREHRLPNRFTYVAMLLAFSSTALLAISNMEYARLMIAAGASLATFGLGYLLAKYADVGMGDVKLLTATNHLLAWFSPWLVLFALTVSFSIASVFGVIGLLSGKLHPKTPIAMGPYLLLGFFIFSGYPVVNSSLEALS